MLRRTRWTVVGMGLGVGTSLYLERKARRALRRYEPPEVGRRMAARAHWAAGELQAAVDAGREEARRTEARLREKADRR